MKNLPEKIYLNLNMTPQEVVETKDKDFHEATKTWEITWSEERLSEHNPEYIRKDAFIEKAYDFFEENIKEEDCKIESSEWTELRAEYKSLDSFIRAFVEYMKGELYVL